MQTVRRPGPCIGFSATRSGGRPSERSGRPAATPGALATRQPVASNRDSGVFREFERLLRSIRGAAAGGRRNLLNSGGQHGEFCLPARLSGHWIASGGRGCRSGRAPASPGHLRHEIARARRTSCPESLRPGAAAKELVSPVLAGRTGAQSPCRPDMQKRIPRQAGLLLVGLGVLRSPVTPPCVASDPSLFSAACRRAPRWFGAHDRVTDHTRWVSTLSSAPLVAKQAEPWRVQPVVAHGSALTRTGSHARQGCCVLGLRSLVDRASRRPGAEGYQRTGLTHAETEFRGADARETAGGDPWPKVVAARAPPSRSERGRPSLGTTRGRSRSRSDLARRALVRQHPRRWRDGESSWLAAGVIAICLLHVGGRAARAAELASNCQR